MSIVAYAFSKYFRDIPIGRTPMKSIYYVMNATIFLRNNFRHTHFSKRYGAGALPPEDMEGF